MKKIYFCQLAFIGLLFASCSETESTSEDISFSFSGSRSGNFKIYGADEVDGSDKWSISGVNDTLLRITGIDWSEVNKRGDIINIFIQSDSSLDHSQILSSDSLNSYAKAQIGFDVPIVLDSAHDGGDEYEIGDSSGYHSIKMTFSFIQYSNVLPGLTCKGSFSGIFVNMKGDTINVSNGKVDIRF